MRLPGFNSTSDSRDLNQHWERHSQGQGSDGSTREQRASFHQTSPSHGDSLWLWLVMSCVTLMTSLLMRLGSRVIQEGVWTHQGAGNRAETLTVPHLCHWSQTQGLCLESLVIIAMAIPASPLILLQDMGPWIWTHQRSHKQRDTGTCWGAPAPDSPQTTPTLK